MKVVFDAMLLKHPFTGVQRYIAGLAEAIHRYCSDITLTAYTGRNLNWEHSPPARHASFGGRGRVSRILWEQAVLPFRLRADAPDVFHAPGYVLPRFASAIGGSPAVLTVHDTTALDMSGLVAWSNRLHYRITMPSSIKRADSIIVPTEAVADRLHKNGLTPKNINVIPWGIDTDIFSEEETDSDATVLNDLGIKKPYVMHAGRIEPKKNLSVLIKAFFAMKAREGLSHNLVLAGPPGRASKAVSTQVRSLAQEGSTVVTGYVDNRSLAALYRGAALAVSPSIEEGFGFPPLEALHCGTPVITSNLPAFRETLGDAVPMFDPADIPSLREHMTLVLTDKAAAEEIIRNGSKRAREYTWEQCARETAKVYRSVL